MPDPVQTLNDLRLRIVQARDLHAEGKHEEAEALTPTPEENRAALRALRADREATAQVSLKKKEKAAQMQSMNLSDLFKAKEDHAS